MTWGSDCPDCGHEDGRHAKSCPYYRPGLLERLGKVLPFVVLSKRSALEIEDALVRASDCARKLEVSYKRREVEPRCEFDRLIEVRERLASMRRDLR